MYRFKVYGILNLHNIRKWRLEDQFLRTMFFMLFGVYPIFMGIFLMVGIFKVFIISFIYIIIFLPFFFQRKSCFIYVYLFISSIVLTLIFVFCLLYLIHENQNGVHMVIGIGAISWFLQYIIYLFYKDLLKEDQSAENVRKAKEKLGEVQRLHEVIA